MNRNHHSRPLAIAALLALGSCATQTDLRPTSAARPSTPAPSARAPAVFPRGFTANHGQWPATVRFRGEVAGALVWVERDAIALDFQRYIGPDRGPMRNVVRLRFRGADPAAELVGEGDAGVRHFLLGEQASDHHVGVPAHHSVRYRQLYPGVDLQLWVRDGTLGYDLLLAAGADPSRIAIDVQGAGDLSVDGGGDLQLSTAFGPLRQPRPKTWQVVDGRRMPITCRYRRLGEAAYGFELPDYDRGHPTVIDPGIDWSSFLGGSSYEFAIDVARSAADDTVVCGETASSNFPVTAGVFDPTYNGFGAPTADVFIASFDPSGTGLRFGTYLGGSSGDKPYGVSIDANGDVVVAGNTQSTNFPTTAGAHSRRLSGRSDCFVTKLSADGSTLRFSTFLGGSAGDVAHGVALDDRGRAAVAGVTSSSDFPRTAGAFGTAPAGTSDAFATLLAADGTSLVFSTLLGGRSGDVAQAVAVDAGGHVVVAGTTSSGDFPTTAGVVQNTQLGTSDAFVVRLTPSGDAAVFATLLGGASGDVAEALATEDGGAVIVTGVSASNDFPTTAGAYSSTAQGSSDAFVTKLSADGQRMLFSTLFGGGSGDVPKGTALERTGAVLIGGQTSSSDLPSTQGAVQAAARGSADGFVARISPDGSAVLYSTYLGGGGSDGGEGLAADGERRVVLAGVTGSSDFPTTAGAVGQTLRGTADGFATQIDLASCGLTSLGSATPSCVGAPALGGTRCPAAGESRFALFASNAPANAAGAILLGGRAIPTGLPLLGATLYLDPTAPLVLLPALSTADGEARLPVPLTNVSSGARAYAQAVWLNPAGCGPTGNASASATLVVTIQ